MKNSLSHVTGVILAGGLGTRLRSVLSDKPKVLAEVDGRPFVSYLLDQLCRGGVKTTILCTGYLGDQVERTLGSSYGNMELRYSRESAPLGTGGALRHALPMLDGASAIILNGDSYCDANLEYFVSWHESKASPATILLARMKDTQRFGRVDIQEDGDIVRFQEKAETSGPGWINAGIYLIERELIQGIPANCPVSIEREIFPKWIKRGLRGFRCAAELWDIGVPDAYAQARAGFASSITQVL